MVWDSNNCNLKWGQASTTVSGAGLQNQELLGPHTTQSQLQPDGAARWHQLLYHFLDIPRQSSHFFITSSKWPLTSQKKSLMWLIFLKPPLNQPWFLYLPVLFDVSFPSPKLCFNFLKYLIPCCVLTWPFLHEPARLVPLTHLIGPIGVWVSFLWLLFNRNYFLIGHISK